jgi:hypothetical protein
LAAAFGSWVPSPGPDAEAVRRIFAIPQRHLTVLVSHGHDDHFDDFVVGRHLSESQFVVPEYGDEALPRRVERAVPGIELLRIGDDPLTVGPFVLSRWINPHLSTHDAIVTIETEDRVVVHANDNWHRQPDETIASISATFAGRDVWYCSQIGIADAFPSAYPDVDDGDAREIVTNRLLGQCETVSDNAIRLGLSTVYIYANQSRIAPSIAYRSIDNQQILREVLDVRAAHDPLVRFLQLMPGDVLPQIVTAPRTESSSHSLLEVLIEGVTARFEAHLKRLGIEDYPRTSFALLGSPALDNKIDGIVYAADQLTWRRILTGEWTLESITIGGSGVVLREPPGRSVRSVHHEISRFAYLLQREILDDGLVCL